MLKIKKLKENAILPKRATKYSSGYDLYTPTDLEISPKSDILVDLGFAVEIPSNKDLTVVNKSGISTKKKLFVGACLIDNDYRGSIRVHLFNFSNNYVYFRAGDKIAQFVLRDIYYDDIIEVQEFDNEITERNTGGFGSTGDR